MDARGVFVLWWLCGYTGGTSDSICEAIHRVVEKLGTGGAHLVSLFDVRDFGVRSSVFVLEHKFHERGL